MTVEGGAGRPRAAGRLSAEPRHLAAVHQILWVDDGRLTVQADGQSWLITKAIALWIPGTLEYEVDARRSQTLHHLQIDPANCPIQWTRPTAILIDAFTRETVHRLDTAHLTSTERIRTEHVLYDVLTPISRADRVEVMPIPTDPRLRAVIEAIRADPGDQRTLAEWGREVGASVRTLSRLFSDETGIPFTQWRREARMHAAAAGVTEGQSVTTIARSVGYSSSSSFIHAFKRHTGHTPTEYADRAEFAGQKPGRSAR